MRVPAHYYSIQDWVRKAAPAINGARDAIDVLSTVVPDQPLRRTDSPVFAGLTVTGTVRTDKHLIVNGAPGAKKLTVLRTNDVTRWEYGASISPESGANSGSNFEVYRFADDGAFLGTAFSISRASGTTNFSNTITARSANATALIAQSTTGNLVNLAFQSNTGDQVRLEAVIDGPNQGSLIPKGTGASVNLGTTGNPWNAAHFAGSVTAGRLITTTTTTGGLLAQYASIYPSSGARGLNIRAPETDDQNAPFIFETPNAITFRIDATDAFNLTSAGDAIFSGSVSAGSFATAKPSPDGANWSHFQNSSATVDFGYSFLRGGREILTLGQQNLDRLFALKADNAGNADVMVVRSTGAAHFAGNVTAGGVTAGQTRITIADPISPANRSAHLITFDGAANAAEIGVRGSGAGGVLDTRITFDGRATWPHIFAASGSAHHTGTLTANGLNTKSIFQVLNNHIGNNLYFDGAWRFGANGHGAMMKISDPNGSFGVWMAQEDNAAGAGTTATLRQTLRFDRDLNAGRGAWLFGDMDGQLYQMDRASLRPRTDNIHALGNGGFRFTQVFAATGTIQTSDETLKAFRGGAADHGDARLTAMEKQAFRAVAELVSVYQWQDAIAAKGADGARLHVGVPAQKAVAAFDAVMGAGAAFRYGWACRDAVPVMETRTVTRQEERPVTEPRTVTRERIDIMDGRAVLTHEEITEEVPVYDAIPLMDGDGNPVMETVDVPAPTDTDPHAVKTVTRPRTHRVPMMERVEITEDIEVQATHPDGTPVRQDRHAIRYDQLILAMLAAQASGTDRPDNRPA